jgi:hypothetical protein
VIMRKGSGKDVYRKVRRALSVIDRQGWHGNRFRAVRRSLIREARTKVARTILSQG